VSITKWLDNAILESTLDAGRWRISRTVRQMEEKRCISSLLLSGYWIIIKDFERSFVKDGTKGGRVVASVK